MGLVSLSHALSPRSVPPAVYEELTVAESGAFLIDPDSCPWLGVASPKDQERVRQLRGDLDRGEVEAIVLAMERRADLPLVDERRSEERRVGKECRL